MNGDLSLAQTPPFSVPLRYMLTAPVFAIAAGILLLTYPESFQNRWNPVTLSVTHLLVLGFAMMVMFGAVQQLVPVLAGVNLNHPEEVSVYLYAGLVTGVVTLAGGLLFSDSVLMIIATVALAITVTAFFVIIMSALLRSDANVNSIAGIRLALLSFLVSVSVGIYLALGHGLPGMAVARDLTSLHFTWGLLGWIGLLVIAVSYQVVPMFQITPKYPPSVVLWLAPFIFVCLVVWSLVEFLPLTPLSFRWAGILPAGGLALGLLVFSLVTLWLQKSRRRKLPDVTLDYFRIALFSLMLAVVCWGASGLWPFGQTEREVLLGVLLIVGFSMSVISGMMYKIVPFLAWLHLTNRPDAGSRPVPTMKSFIAERHIRRQFQLHLGAVVMLAAASFAGVWMVRFAALLFTASNVYLLANLITAAMVYRRHLIT